MTAHESALATHRAIRAEIGSDKPGYFGDDPSTLTHGKERGPRGPYEKVKGSTVRVRQPSKGYTPSYKAVVHLPRPGEMLLKEFLITESQRLGIRPLSVYAKIIDRRPGYDQLTIRRVSPKCAFVSGVKQPNAP